MMTDNAPAKFSIFSKMLDGGDTGRRGVEHRSFMQLWFTHHKNVKTGFFIIIEAPPDPRHEWHPSRYTSSGCTED